MLSAIAIPEKDGLLPRYVANSIDVFCPAFFRVAAKLSLHCLPRYEGDVSLALPFVQVHLVSVLTR